MPFSSSLPDDARRDLLASLCILGFVVAAVLCGLAYDANWRKFLRISIAAFSYVAALLTLLRPKSRAAVSRGRLPFWPFAASAGACELASGWLRPGVPAGTTLWVAPLAAILIGGLHWLTLLSWRPLRNSFIFARPRTRTPQRPSDRAS